VACIAEVLGLPPREFVERSPRRDRHFDSAGRWWRPIDPLMLLLHVICVRISA
jgi:hypothetical protein